MPFFSHKRTLFALAIIVGVLIWNHNRPPDHTQTQEPQSPLPKVTPSPQPSKVEPTPTATAGSPAPPTPPATAKPATAPALPAATSQSATRVLPGSVTEIPAVTEEDLTEELSAVDATIRSFQAVHGENPIGSNAEITAALLGNNLKQIKLEVPAGSQLNGAGEMCDRWGTPYFFHQVSRTEMEIRSAGPDRQMWTGDDSEM